MKKVILIFVTIVLSGLLYAKDNKSTDAFKGEETMRVKVWSV